MILTDLLDKPVQERDGRSIGYVIDVRFAVDGPPDELLARVRLHGLLISPRTRTPFLGYERSSVSSPWPIAQLMRWWHRGTFMVRWEDVEEAEPLAVHVRDGYRRWSSELA
jgi:sporulation protein YlmC with PRC-barrel domain